MVEVTKSVRFDLEERYPGIKGGGGSGAEAVVSISGPVFAAPRRGGGVEVVSKIRVESATETSRAPGLRVSRSLYYYRNLLLKMRTPF